MCTMSYSRCRMEHPCSPHLDNWVCEGYMQAVACLLVSTIVCARAYTFDSAYLFMTDLSENGSVQQQTLLCVYV